MDEQDGQLAQSLARRDEASFETVFKTHFKNLHPQHQTAWSPGYFSIFFFKNV
jgi:hypothetical protein